MGSAGLCPQDAECGCPSGCAQMFEFHQGLSMGCEGKNVQ